MKPFLFWFALALLSAGFVGYSIGKRIYVPKGTCEFSDGGGMSYTVGDATITIRCTSGVLTLSTKGEAQ